MRGRRGVCCWLQESGKKQEEEDLKMFQHNYSRHKTRFVMPQTSDGNEKIKLKRHSPPPDGVMQLLKITALLAPTLLFLLFLSTLTTNSISRSVLAQREISKTSGTSGNRWPNQVAHWSVRSEVQSKKRAVRYHRVSPSSNQAQLFSGVSGDKQRLRSIQPQAPVAARKFHDSQQQATSALVESSNNSGTRQPRNTRRSPAAAATTRSSPFGQSSASAPQVVASASKCALILQRTFVRKIGDTGSGDDILGDGDEHNNVEPTGSQESVCITYQAVNNAIALAKQRRSFKPTSDLLEAVESIEPEPPYIAQLGELNQEVTKILAQKFDLSADEILNGLPLIDMSRTDFWPLCPLMVRPLQCDPTGRFRSFTGHCNNLQHPSWGAAQTPFVRYLAPRHPDGIEQDRVSVIDGSPLPSPRAVSSLIHRDHDSPSNDLSLLVMVWGQIIDHDMALAAPPRDEQGMDFNCCKQPGRHPNCKPIEIPANDKLYSRYGQTCMDFKRSLAGLRPNCALGPRVHINTITSTIDANTIYGSTKEIADSLRTFSGGLLKVQEPFNQMGLKPLLPKQLIRPDLDCFERPANAYCFLGGDERVNEQPTLTVLHTIYVRDHNRLASQLAALNAHWDDDRIYHETRHLEAAMVQHVLMNEYLPLLVGKHMMEMHNLTEMPPNLHWQGYNPQVTPAISQGFSTAAFRQGHTFIQGRVRLHDPRTHAFLDSIQLRQLFKRPWHYYMPGRIDQVLTGIVDTPAQTYDPFITEEIAGHLFQEPGEQFGMDLPAINMARGREQGTPGYTAYREWCGLQKPRTFEDLVPLMANRTAFKYAQLYKHVDDIDLWSGGVSERRLEGAQVGPTFSCLIARQFANLKRGDRFWYENAGFPSSFTMEQLREIKKTTQARLICKNSDNLEMIQMQALRRPHAIYNPRVPCSQVPDLDLNYWREDPSNLGSFYSNGGAANNGEPANGET